MVRGAELAGREQVQRHHRLRARTLREQERDDGRDLLGTHETLQGGDRGVHDLDGKPLLSKDEHPRPETTLEGLGTKDNPGRVQRAFIEEQAARLDITLGEISEMALG